MLFQQYRDTVDRINVLFKPQVSLTRAQRNELLDLSGRQEELERHIGQEIRTNFKELLDGLDIVAEWVKLMQEDAIKALGVEGTPEDVLALEGTLEQVASLNKQISSITLAKYITPEISKPEPVKKLPVNEPSVFKLMPSPLPIHSSIDIIDYEKEKIVNRVLDEISDSMVSAAPTFEPEVFNQPRVTIQRRPSKRKKR